MKTEIKGNKLIVELDLYKSPKQSASGKSHVVASTHGNYTGDATINGKSITVSCNAFIRE